MNFIAQWLKACYCKTPPIILVEFLDIETSCLPFNDLSGSMGNDEWVGKHFVLDMC